MERWLYIFPGFPGKRNDEVSVRHLHAGGLRHLIMLEELAVLEEDRYIQARKEGLFFVNEDGTESEEPAGELHIVMSPRLIAGGITEGWFPEGYTFANVVTISKTVASPAIKTVVYGTELSMTEFLDKNGGTSEGLVYERKHIRHSSWRAYEDRWLPNTCPQQNHQVFLTYFLTTAKMADTALERITDVIERKAEPEDLELYDLEQHFNQSRTWKGKSAVGILGAR